MYMYMYVWRSYSVLTVAITILCSVDLSSIQMYTVEPFLAPQPKTSRQHLMHLWMSGASQRLCTTSPLDVSHFDRTVDEKIKTWCTWESQLPNLCLRCKYWFLSAAVMFCCFRIDSTTVVIQLKKRRKVKRQPAYLGLPGNGCQNGIRVCFDNISSVSGRTFGL